MANPLMAPAQSREPRKPKTPQDLADEANERTQFHPRRQDGELVWIPTATGGIKLVTQPDWLARYQREQARSAEEERRRFNHRRANPLEYADE
jgi:hypothetical protein